MRIETIFERFLIPRTRTEPPKELSKKAGWICAKAGDWAVDQVRHDSLLKEPYGLLQYELAIIKNSLAEERVPRLLAKYPAVKGAEMTVELNNFFQKKVGSILRSMILEHNLDAGDETAVNVLSRHLEFCQEEAKELPWQENDFMAVFKLCNQIKTHRPVILRTHTKLNT